MKNRANKEWAFLPSRLWVLGVAILLASAGIKVSAQSSHSNKSENFSIYLQNGISGSQVPTIGKAFKASPVIGFGADYTIYPYLRVGGAYKWSSHEHQQQVTKGTEQSTAYHIYHSAKYHSLQVALGVNLLEAFHAENPYGLGLWLSTGVGALLGSASNHGLSISRPKNLENNGIDNIEADIKLRSAHVQNAHASCYIPFALQLEAPLNKEIDLGITLQADKAFGAKEYAPSTLLAALVSVRYNFGVIR